MPRLVRAAPKYRKHSASGQAVVTIAGKVEYLGPYGTKTSHKEYDRLVGEWLANGRPSTLKATVEELTVTELAAAFWKYAQQKYRKNGRPTGTADNFKPILSLLRKRYGHTAAAEFGPLALKALVNTMIAEGCTRRYANDNLHRIRRIFRWAQSEQRLPRGVYEDLLTVECIAAGNTPARESEPVRPVGDGIVNATLPYLPEVVGDMVRLQRLTGARPGEVCLLRPCDVDRSESVWRYVPWEHKTQHHGKRRVIFIGPKAQAILRPYLLRAETEYCFRPCDSERRRLQVRHEQRVTPMSCGNKPNGNRRTNGRAPGLLYTNDGYRRAIVRGCELAFKMPAELRKIPAKLDHDEKLDRQQRASAWRAENTWAPNQLRHTVGTEVRKKYGIEGAQVVLGHSKAAVTEIYAERDLDKAAAIMAEVG
jgi:integrase